MSETLKGFVFIEEDLNLLPKCKTFEEHSCMLRYWLYMIFPGSNELCSKPICQIIQYKAKSRNYMDLKNVASTNKEGLNVWILSSSMNKIVYDQYLVYDFLGMVGSIGGSLGLFVGFSIFDYACKVMDMIFRRLIQN